MNHWMHTAVCALVLGLLALGCFALRYTYSPGDLQDMIRRSEENERLEQVTLRRQQAERQAAQAYIAQRCTLAQTMQRWQQLEQQLGQEWPLFRDVLEQHAMSDEQRYYGGIRAHVEAILRGQPAELAGVLRRLEKEYQQLRADRKMPSTLPTKRTEPSR
jgi:heme/copper-type cytochrome/quinol oxidase subunit 1